MSPRTWLRQRIGRRGQSLVEFTVLLPVLLIMLSGLIEFGFMLNYYLDLIDAAREVARFAAGDDPIHDINGNFEPRAWVTPEPYGFYDRAWALTQQSLAQAGQIALDPATDDLVVSVFSVSGGTVTARFPPPFTYSDPITGKTCTSGGEDGWRKFCNRKSSFTTSEINALLDSMAPNTGLVLVEIYYDYHMVLSLPWITAFVEDPVTLYAYSIMPNTASEPTPTPLP